MNKSKRRVLFSIVGGVLLVAVGVISLLANFGVLTLNWEMVIGPMLAVGGLVFLLVFISNSDEWWALIPGFILIGVGVNIFMGQFMGAITSNISGAIFLVFVGLPFIMIYLFHHHHWWALIPGGVLLTMAGVNLVTNNSALEGGVFFLGISITFGLVYLLPKPSGKLTWALYPAGILLLVGVIIILGATNLLGYIGPLALLIIGGYVLYRAIRK
jgi:hypothetical protein